MRRGLMRGPTVLAVVAAATLLAAGFALIANAKPAEAAFPGANGKIVYDFAGTGDYDIGAINPDRTGAANVTRNEGIHDLQPAWSADGARIAFVGYPWGQSNEIYTMDADGGARKQLTNTRTLEEESPTWSPDGSRIAFHVRAEGSDGYSTYDLYVMNADGTGTTRLTTNPGIDYDPAWSPDGTKIVFGSARDGRYGVYTMAPVPEGDANRPRRLAGGGGSSFDWSPDGEKIALTVNVRPQWHDGQYEIYTMNADGTGRTRLTFGRGEDRDPAWSPDGRKVAFARDRDVFVMNPAPEGDTNRPRRITDYARASAFNPDWQPIP